jgi:hypothetical protein
LPLHPVLSLTLYVYKKHFNNILFHILQEICLAL